MYTDNRIEAMLILDKLATLAEASSGFVSDSCVARVSARATCLSVCPSVRLSVHPSVTRRYCIELQIYYL